MHPLPRPRTSFFDDDDLRKAFEFIKPLTKHQEDLNKPAILSANLHCEGLHHSLSKQATFALHNKLLAYYPSENLTSPEFVLKLSYSRVRSVNPLIPGKSHGLKLTKNGQSYELYFTDEHTKDNWLKALKNVCVLESFHDDFRAIRGIGKGSFAKVYLMECNANKNQYAVKCFLKEKIFSNGKDKAKPSMLNEISILRELDHDNIIKLYEVHETERSIYLVMELIQGHTLHEVLKGLSKKDGAERKAMNLFRSILEAIGYTASKGIMHRDLKPANILVEKGIKIKVADYGLATHVNVSKLIFRKCGTPGYMAPEVFKYDAKIKSTHYNESCDMFSLGCILYYMLFGTQMFETDDVSEIIYANKKFTMEHEAVLKIRQELDNPLGRINKDGLNLLLKLLELDPKKRITSSEALNHSYFGPVVRHLKSDSKDCSSDQYLHKKSTDSKDHINESPLKKSDSGPVSLATLKSPDELKEDGSGSGSFLMPAANKFAEKDSLLINVAKTTNSICVSNGSIAGSILMRTNSADPNSNPPSPSTFGKPVFLAAIKKGKQSRSYRGPNDSQKYLKAAIFNNMQKHDNKSPEATTDDVKDDEIVSVLSARGGHNRAHSKASSTKPEGDSDHDVDMVSSDLDEDVGDEDNHAQNNLDHIKDTTKEKHPGKMLLAKGDSRRLLKKQVQ